MDIIIGIGEYGISNRKDDVLKTFALASCVGVTMYCRQVMAAGMIHIVLPNHQIKGGNLSKPGYYASLGVPMLIEKMEKEFKCNKKDLVIQLFGGANSICKSDLFLIGKKNIQAISNILTKMNLRYSLSEVGGNMSRTIEMDILSGQVKIHTQPIKI